MSTARVSNWYATLTPRDQRVLQIGAVVVVLILLLAVFLPLQRNLGEAREKLQTQQDDLDWMRRVAPALAAAGPGPVSSTTSESLPGLVDSTARESGLGKAHTGSDQTSSGSLRVQMENADFNALTAWLSRLTSQHGVRIESTTITAARSAGMVSASIQLSAR